MKLSAETNHLLQKRFHQAVQPVEIAAIAIASTLVSALVAYCRCAEIRFRESGLASLFIVICVVVTALVVVVAHVRRRNRRPSRPWIAASTLLVAGLVAGFSVGNKYWYQHSASYFLYGTMASYVNVDPGAEQGQTFMDAGTIYFKEGSFVLKSKALAFRNGRTYCVAPILRRPPAGNASGPTASGTVDFWAVGTDCCDRGGAFTCDDAGSEVARSGLRLLDDSSRAMYLLAVQEWSAGTGIPVRHPIFFRWVKDPIVAEENDYAAIWQEYTLFCVVFFFASAAASFTILHILMKFQVN